MNEYKVCWLVQNVHLLTEESCSVEEENWEIMCRQVLWIWEKSIHDLQSTAEESQQTLLTQTTCKVPTRFYGQGIFFSFSFHMPNFCVWIWQGAWYLMVFFGKLLKDWKGNLLIVSSPSQLCKPKETCLTSPLKYEHIYIFKRESWLAAQLLILEHLLISMSPVNLWAMP